MYEGEPGKYLGDAKDWNLPWYVEPLNFKRFTMFKSAFNLPDHASVYPGEYEPLPGKLKALSDELISNKAVNNPPFQVFGQNDYYRVDLPAPGFKREDFLVHTDGQILSIAGIRLKPHPDQGLLGYQLQSDCIYQDIHLPPDVDTEFVTAEFENGILTIWIFRTNNPVLNNPAHIVVH